LLLRPDYLGRGDTPVLDALAAQGASAPMRPSFPSLTFPNHCTNVTGLRPDRHGTVNNSMEDTVLPGVRFGMSNRDANPAIRSGVRLRAFDNVDVHPLLLALLGLPRRDTDGTLDTRVTALRGASGAANAPK
jgi:predicted AlkP superfamily pyrophosphatase or phosphodiesterase